MINRRTFFYDVRVKLFGGRLDQRQVDGMNAILDEWEKRGLTEPRWLAYALATAFWETAHTMWPIEEWGKGQGHPYGMPDPATAQVYYGRGFVQLTWKSNYATMGRLLGIDLVSHPDKSARAACCHADPLRGNDASGKQDRRLHRPGARRLFQCHARRLGSRTRHQSMAPTTRRRSPTSVEHSTRLSSRPRPATKTRGWPRNAADLARQLAPAVGGHRRRGRPGMGLPGACSSGRARAR